MTLPLSFIFISSFLFLTILCTRTSSRKFKDDRYLSPESYAKMKGDEIIRFYGYPGEEHKVLTEDGYILTNFRMANPGGYPILFLHGMLATSDCFLLTGPKKNFAFWLWKRGYDVWFWNARGNMYSTEHVNLTYDNDKFFRFSMHELGIYDTTASIDYILNVTGHKDVITIGHSMGTTNVLIAASMRPEYQAKIRLNILWAQGVFNGNSIARGHTDTQYSRYVRWWNHRNVLRVLERGSVLLGMMQSFCSPTAITKELCYKGMEISSGIGSNQTDKEAVMKMVTKYPAGSSLNVFKQQVQNMRGIADFKPLSYGRKENLKRYGTEVPYPYPIGKVTIPTAMYYGCCNDFLSHVKDNYILKSRLTNLVKFYSVPYKKFNHGDFLWAADGYRLLYKDNLKLIDRYIPSQFRSNVTIPSNDLRYPFSGSEI